MQRRLLRGLLETIPQTEECRIEGIFPPFGQERRLVEVAQEEDHRPVLVQHERNGQLAERHLRIVERAVSAAQLEISQIERTFIDPEILLADRRTGPAHFALQHIERRGIGHVARPEEIGQIARARRREFRTLAPGRNRNREVFVIARNLRGIQILFHSEEFEHLQTDQLLAMPRAGKSRIGEQPLDRDGYARGFSSDEASALLIHAELQRRGIGKVSISATRFFPIS